MSKVLKCLQCGTEFCTDHPRKKFCSPKCTNKYHHKPKTLLDDSVAKDMLSRLNGDWEYVGGYTGSDGSMDVKHIPCGTVTTKTCTTIRHNKIRCSVCEAKEREQLAKEKEQKKAIEKEVRSFFKRIKRYEQIKAKECPVCGCFFYDSRAKYCSEECSKETIRHYWNMKNERRRKQSYTEESKTITLKKLFDRDGGTCWICGGACDYDADSNDNDYPSIDHVIPIVRGGKDEWNNIRLAHRLCNSKKWMNVVEINEAGMPSVGVND